MVFDDLFADITPATALGISVSNYADGQIELAAPLQPNLNDKGTAFAGSISSMLVLTGWGVVTATLKEAGISADVLVVKSETEYTEPVRNTMTSEASISKKELGRILKELEIKKRSRVSLTAQLYSGSAVCAEMNAHYAILIR